MASIRAGFEESNIDDDSHSNSKAAYTNFNPLTAGDSVEQKKIAIDGDVAHHHPTDGEVKECQVWQGVFESHCCKYVDIIATMVIIALVWVMMTLPTVFYIETLVCTPST